MIKPTPGRVVWYHPSAQDLRGRNDPPMAVFRDFEDRPHPLAAIVAGVLSDRRVNLSVIDANGRQYQRQDVILRQGDESDLVTDGSVAYAEWMPYQKAQAEKHAVSASDLETEKLIKSKGLTAPRISLDHVMSLIAGETFTMTPSGRTMVCELTLANGFTVRGESSVVSAANFDEELGRKVSRENAVKQIWGFEAYLLMQRLHERKTGDESVRDKIDRIARVCHEVNRAYCQALGDNSQPAWEDAPAWQRESARMGADLHLSGDFGPEASHISWMNQKIEEGWVYGPIKDATLKQHPCMVPFNQLSVEQQAKDFIFRAVVHALKDS